jgi:hypothetical protein
MAIRNLTHRPKSCIYSGCQPYAARLRLCSGSINAAARQTSQKAAPHSLKIRCNRAILTKMAIRALLTKMVRYTALTHPTKEGARNVL